MSQRPAEDAAWTAQHQQHAQTLADIATNPHNAEVQAAHEGRPSLAEQDRTHGAPRPAEDRGASPHR